MSIIMFLNTVILRDNEVTHTIQLFIHLRENGFLFIQHIHALERYKKKSLFFSRKARLIVYNT